jgi:hypothetical protein
MRRAFKFSLGLVVLFAALSIVLLTATIYTYARLTDEALIAELRFDATGDEQYVAHLRTGDRCEERSFPLFGDQWRVDAEFLKWKYWALLLGLDSQYRLDRLEGRYRAVAEQNMKYPGTASHRAVDLVSSRVARSWNFPLDATYGSSTCRTSTSTTPTTSTTTGIITRHEPRPVQPANGASFNVTIDGARAAVDGTASPSGRRQRRRRARARRSISHPSRGNDMNISMRSLATLAAAAAVGFAAGHLGDNGRAAAQFGAFTALDYQEITQLINRYASASMRAAGYDYANLFATDGVHRSQLRRGVAAGGRVLAQGRDASRRSSAAAAAARQVA